MKKPNIRITLVGQKGTMGCHRGHQVGDSYDFDTERGKLCRWRCTLPFPMSIFCDTVANCPVSQMEPFCFAARTWTSLTSFS